MQPDLPEYSPKNQHYLISGVDPRYWRAQSSVQEKYAAPLAASSSWLQVSSSVSGPYLSCMMPSFASAYDIIAIDDGGVVHGLKTPNTLLNLGTPGFGSGTEQTTAASYNGSMFVADSSSSFIYKKLLTDLTTGGWTTPITKRSYGNGYTSLCPFLDFLTFADTPSGVSGLGNFARSTVRKYDTSGTLSDCITLSKSTSGVNVWDIVAIENYRNQYLAVAGIYAPDGTPVTSVAQSGYGYVFLWDGKASTYNTSVQIPGNFVSMKTVQGTLYVITQERTGQYAVWYLVGTNFKRMGAIAIDTPKTTINGVLRTDVSLFEYSSQLGINLSLQGQYIYSSDAFIISPISMDRVVRATNGLLYGSSGTGLYCLNGTQSSPIFYRSQWLPIENVLSVVVKYATPPQVTNDYIQITLDGYDEDGLASSGLILNQITSTTFYNAYKTMLDAQGYQGKETRITLSTNSAGSWQPIIREIELIAPDK